MKAVYDRIVKKLADAKVAADVTMSHTTIYIDCNRPTSARDALGMNRYRDYIQNIEVIIL